MADNRHERIVESCDNCPLCMVMYYDGVFCILEGRWVEEESPNLPTWCPLRLSDLTVRLAKEVE